MIFFILVPGKPSKILNFQAVASCSRVTLTWEPPKDDGGMPINKYVLNCTSNYKDITRDIHANDTSYTINDLKQNSTYNITLRATNKAEWGLTSSMEIKTTEYCEYSTLLCCLHNVTMPKYGNEVIFCHP